MNTALVWILVVSFSGYYTTGVTSLGPFTDLASCERAQGPAMAGNAGLYGRIRTQCVQVSVPR